MFQGDALNRQGTVFVDYFLNRSVNRMKVYFIVEIVAEQSHLPVQDVFHFLWSIDSQTGCSPQQPKGKQWSPCRWEMKTALILVKRIRERRN